MSHYNSSPDDRWNRERFLIEYLAPFYDQESIENTVILPLTSSVDRVVRNKSLLYKDRPVRGLVNQEGKPHAKDPLYQDIIRQAKIGSTAKKWHRKYGATGAVLVRPVLVQHNNKARIKYQVLTPDKFRLLMDEDYNVLKVAYLSELTDEAGGITENIIVIWTPDSHYYYTAGSAKAKAFDGNPNMENPYGMIPFVLAAKDEEAPFDNGLHDLVEENLQMNLLEALKLEDAAFAAMNVPFGVNLTNPKQDWKFSPRSGIFTDGHMSDESTPSFDFRSGTPHSELINTLIGDKEKRSSLREGVSPHLVSAEPTELSGKALQIMSSEALQMREDDIDVFQDFERELAAVTSVVWNLEQGEKLPTYEEMQELFYVDFAEVRFDDDPAAELEYDIRLRDANLTNEVELAMKYNSDVNTEDEALEMLQRNAEINRQYRSRGYGFGNAQAANQIVQQNALNQ
jgi:hypothetical protein